MSGYLYECEKHGEVEIDHPMSEVGKDRFCDQCGDKMIRIISAPSISLKGGGWYKDGYDKGGSK